MSAEQGNAKSQLCLGEMFLHGEGIRKDVGEAKKWMTKAADQGLPEARRALENISNFKATNNEEDLKDVFERNLKHAESGDGWSVKRERYNLIPSLLFTPQCNYKASCCRLALSHGNGGEAGFKEGGRLVPQEH